ncbi:MAG: hypothetical protein JOY54_03535 [Acidobacteriaceae bacterium]|nr:hypothetical protein [Acidobacteriaceae bacterium]
MMTRAYTSFPNGGAAIGLLLLRFLSGGGVAEQSCQTLCGLLTLPDTKTGTLSEITAACALVLGILIIVGLWTSLATSLTVILGLTSAALGLQPLESLLLVWLAFAIGLVGPGAFSLDARLFGWKQIRFPNTRSN